MYCKPILDLRVLAPTLVKSKKTYDFFWWHSSVSLPLYICSFFNTHTLPQLFEFITTALSSFPEDVIGVKTGHCLHKNQGVHFYHCYHGPMHLLQIDWWCWVQVGLPPVLLTPYYRSSWAPLPFEPWLTQQILALPRHFCWQTLKPSAKHFLCPCSSLSVSSKFVQLQHAGALIHQLRIVAHIF